MIFHIRRRNFQQRCFEGLWILAELCKDQGWRRKIGRKTWQHTFEASSGDQRWKEQLCFYLHYWPAIWIKMFLKLGNVFDLNRQKQKMVLPNKMVFSFWFHNRDIREISKTEWCSIIARRKTNQFLGLRLCLPQVRFTNVPTVRLPSPDPLPLIQRERKSHEWNNYPFTWADYKDLEMRLWWWSL